MSGLTISKLRALESIREQILTNNICPDLAASATQLVMGEGSPDAQVVFIGEAPGRREDETGLPFVGASGKLLDKMLESIGLDRSEVFITSIVKYRPPKNRDPKPEEKEAFWPYMLMQISIIRPAIVVTLGRHSMEYFLPGAKISDIHGQPAPVRVQLYDKDEVDLVIVPFFHPAAAIYNSSLKQTLFDDFAKLPGIIHDYQNSDS